MQITKQQLIDKLMTNVGVINVVVEITNTPTMKKMGNPFKSTMLTKTAIYEGTIGKRYSDEAEKTNSDYIPKKRTWGTLINPYLIEHKGNYYLQIFVDKTNPPTYKMGDQIIPESTIMPWLHERSDETIVIRDIKIENIKNIALIYKSANAVVEMQQYEII